MAIEFSVAAGGARLQQYNDQKAAYARQLKDAEAVQVARNKELATEARRRVETIDREVERARLSREDVQRLQERTASFDRLARDELDQGVDQTYLRRRSDIAAADEEAAYNRAAIQAQEDDALAAEQARSAAPLTSTQPSGNRYDAYLASRNARLADRANSDAAFAAASQQDYARSARSVDAVRTNPDLIANEQNRGGIVDFSA